MFQLQWPIILIVANCLSVGSCGDEKGSRAPPLEWELPAACNDVNGDLSSCMRNAHSGARQCVLMLEKDPGFKGCRNDTNYKLSNEVWFELSYLWHKTLGRCLQRRTHFPLQHITKKRAISETETKALSGDTSIPALTCFKKVGIAISKCNKDIMAKCQRYKNCYNRLDVSALRGYKDEADKKQVNALKKCYKQVKINQEIKNLA